MIKKQIPIYRPILKKAWAITRQNKFLWIFGLLAVLIGNSGVYEILIKNFFRIISQGEIFLQKINWFWGLGIFAWPRLEELTQVAPLFASLFWLIFFIILIFLAAIIWLSIVSRSALIHCVQKLSTRKKTNFKDGWTIGNKYFWLVLILNILAKSLIFSLLVLITIPVIFFITEGSGNTLWNLLLYILAFVVFTALALIIAFMAIYASCFVVIGNKSLVEAIYASWRLFIRNWLTSIEMALILFLIILGVGIGFILFSLLYFIPITLLLMVLTYLELSFYFWLIVFLAALGWLFALLLVSAFLTTFQFSVWALLFLELNKRKIWSKLLRFVGIKK